MLIPKARAGACEHELRARRARRARRACSGSSHFLFPGSLPALLLLLPPFSAAALAGETSHHGLYPSGRPQRSDDNLRASTATSCPPWLHISLVWVFFIGLWLQEGPFAAPPVPACGHWPSGGGWGCCSVGVRVGSGLQPVQGQALRVHIAVAGWQLSLGQAWLWCLLPSAQCHSAPCVVSASVLRTVLVQYSTTSKALLDPPGEIAS